MSSTDFGPEPRSAGRLAGLARAAGAAVGGAALGVIYLLVFLPLGLLLRASGRLRITRSPDPDARSYWRPAQARATPRRRTVTDGSALPESSPRGWP